MDWKLGWRQKGDTMLTRFAALRVRLRTTVGLTQVRLLTESYDKSLTDDNCRGSTDVVLSANETDISLSLSLSHYRDPTSHNEHALYSVLREVMSPIFAV